MTTRGSQRRGPRKILHVVGGMRPGGVENWLLRVLRSVDRDQYAMDFLVHAEGPCAYDPDILRQGGRILRCPHVRRPWQYARELRRIFRACGPYDIIHSHVYLFSGYVLTLAHMWGIPIRIAHFHTPMEPSKAGTPRALYEALMMALVARNATCIIANSWSTMRSVGGGSGRSDGREHVIYPLTREATTRAEKAERMATRKLHGLPHDEPVVIYLARFAPLKNHAQMVRIADAFRDRGIRAHFVLAGSHGALLDHFSRAAACRDNLTLLTEFDDVQRLLACADMFFFPSLKEGFGIVAHEAAASGLPVIASDLPGLREAVSPACHGLLFRPDDDAEALEQLTRLLADPGRRSQLAEQSLAWASSMTPHESIRQLLAVYDGSGEAGRVSSSATSTDVVGSQDAGDPGRSLRVSQVRRSG